MTIVPNTRRISSKCLSSNIKTFFIISPYIVRSVTKGRHIRLEVLLDVVKPKGRFVLDMIFFLVSAFFFGYIGYLSIGIVGNVIKMGQLTPALMIPKWLCYLALPVGTILGSLRFLQYGYKRIIRFKKDPTDTRTIVVEGEEEV